MASPRQQVVEGYVQYPFVVKQWRRRGEFASTPVGPHQASWPHAGGSERRFHGADPRTLRTDGQSLATTRAGCAGKRADGGHATCRTPAHGHVRAEPEPQAATEIRGCWRQSSWSNANLLPRPRNHRPEPWQQGISGSHRSGWQPLIPDDPCREPAAAAAQALIREAGAKFYKIMKLSSLPSPDCVYSDLRNCSDCSNLYAPALGRRLERCGWTPQPAARLEVSVRLACCCRPHPDSD
jgi:hypothetical protein